MKTGKLTDYFKGVACKKLSQVETGKSKQHHQHEFNSIKKMQEIFGSERQTFTARFLYLDDDVRVASKGIMTWYDARENDPTRPAEFRFYFSGNLVPAHAKPGDALILALRPDNTVLVIVCAQGAVILPQLLWLFGIPSLGRSFAMPEKDAVGKADIGAAARFILAQLDIEPEANEDGWLETMLTRFNGNFPATRIFSDFARSTVESNCLDDPDGALVLWMEREERLFRILERYQVEKRLAQGRTGKDPVDEFIKYSLSVHNRRKSRAGAALENHFEYLLKKWDIRNSRTPVTEGKSRPDFLFPGIDAYRDPAFPALRLTMLGAKTSTRDRWRQILAEAVRIPHKHLLTLQVGMSADQLAEMASHHVTPVIPQAFRQEYTESQQKGIITIADFLQLVKSRQ